MTVLVDARHALLTGLIDYAGLFPPTSLEIEAAVARRREVTLPGLVRHDRAVLLGHRDRTVGGPGVDDDDLVDQASQ